MIILKSVEEFKIWRSKQTATIGFVPTMGGLHQGHLSLMEKSLSQNETTVVSVFLNPTQFNNAEDLKKYPSSIKEDLAILKSLNVDALFLPTTANMYPEGYNYLIQEQVISKTLCGKDRPGHFEGVLTVVMKLLNIVKPQKLYMGEKDFQQLQLIKGMIKDFFMDIELIPVAIVREDSGLALSTRNRRLSAESKSKAIAFAKILQTPGDLNETKSKMESLGLKLDYLEDWKDRRLAAVQIDNIRLIDNVQK